jgi:hypothetical protein
VENVRKEKDKSARKEREIGDWGGSRWRGRREGGREREGWERGEREERDTVDVGERVGEGGERYCRCRRKSGRGRREIL